MLSPETSTLLTLCCYGAATVAGLAGMLLRNAFWRRLGCWLAGLGFVCQTFSLLLGFHKTMPTGLSLGGYLQMLAWFVLLCGLVSRLRYKQEALLLLATPLALILFAVSAPYLSAVVQVPPQLKGSFYALHVGALFLSMGLMTLAFAASSLFLFLERRIKSKQRMEGFWQDMPSPCWTRSMPSAWRLRSRCTRWVSSPACSGPSPSTVPPSPVTPRKWSASSSGCSWPMCSMAVWPPAGAAASLPA